MFLPSCITPSHCLVTVLCYLQELCAQVTAAQAQTQEAAKVGNDRYNQLMAVKLQAEAALQNDLKKVIVTPGCSVTTRLTRG